MGDAGTTAPTLPGWASDFCLRQRLPASYASEVAAHASPLARNILALRRRKGRPVIIGIAGAQGSGKTTLGRFLELWLLRELHSRCARLSLDDVYLGRAARLALSRSVHPLLATRGVPGTHDLPLAVRLLAELTDGGARAVRLPRFDKARDDRAPESDWPVVTAPVEAVLLEGWCVGARPQAEQALAGPVNELEATGDVDGAWRRYVNHRLETDYADLFGQLDALVLLRVPSFNQARAWRRLQERKLRDDRPGDDAGEHGLRTDAEVDRFVMHFERLTRHMLETMPAYADSVIEVDTGHRLAQRLDRGWAFAEGAG